MADNPAGNGPPPYFSTMGERVAVPETIAAETRSGIPELRAETQELRTETRAIRHVGVAAGRVLQCGGCRLQHRRGPS